VTNLQSVLCNVLIQDTYKAMCGRWTQLNHGLCSFQLLTQSLWQGWQTVHKWPLATGSILEILHRTNTLTLSITKSQSSLTKATSMQVLFVWVTHGKIFHHPHHSPYRGCDHCLKRQTRQTDSQTHTVLLDYQLQYAETVNNQLHQ